MKNGETDDPEWFAELWTYSAKGKCFNQLCCKYAV